MFSRKGTIEIMRVYILRALLKIHNFLMKYYSWPQIWFISGLGQAQFKKSYSILYFLMISYTSLKSKWLMTPTKTANIISSGSASMYNVIAFEQFLNGPISQQFWYRFFPCIHCHCPVSTSSRWCWACKISYVDNFHFNLLNWLYQKQSLLEGSKFHLK